MQYKTTPRPAYGMVPPGSPLTGKMGAGKEAALAHGSGGSFWATIPIMPLLEDFDCGNLGGTLMSRQARSMVTGGRRLARGSHRRSVAVPYTRGRILSMALL